MLPYLSSAYFNGLVKNNSQWNQIQCCLSANSLLSIIFTHSPTGAFHFTVLLLLNWCFTLTNSSTPHYSFAPLLSLLSHFISSALLICACPICCLKYSHSSNCRLIRAPILSLICSPLISFSLFLVVSCFQCLLFFLLVFPLPWLQVSQKKAGVWRGKHKQKVKRKVLPPLLKEQ